MKISFIPVMIVLFIVAIIIAMIRMDTTTKAQLKVDSTKDTIKIVPEIPLTKQQLDSIDKAKKVQNQVTDTKIYALARAERSVRNVFVARETDKVWVYLARNDDGTKADGFADYFCQALKDKGISEKRKVIIVDAGENRQGEKISYAKRLGNSECPY